MTKQQIALKLALEALESANDGMNECHKEVGFDFANEQHDVEQAITAIREALAEQPAQQPKLSDYEPDGMHHNKPQKCKYPHCAYPCPDLPDCRDAEQPAQQQEPVAWLKVVETPGGWGKFVEAKPREKGAKPVYTSPPASKPWVGLTDRENAVIHFALHRFMADACAQMTAAAQDKDNRYFKPGAVDAFAKDAKDAEALLAKLREKNA